MAVLADLIFHAKERNLLRVLAQNEQKKLKIAYFSLTPGIVYCPLKTIHSHDRARVTVHRQRYSGGNDLKCQLTNYHWL